MPQVDIIDGVLNHLVADIDVGGPIFAWETPSCGLVDWTRPRATPAPYCGLIVGIVSVTIGCVDYSRSKI